MDACGFFVSPANEYPVVPGPPTSPMWVPPVKVRNMSKLPISSPVEYTLTYATQLFVVAIRYGVPSMNVLGDVAFGGFVPQFDSEAPPEYGSSYTPNDAPSK